MSGEFGSDDYHRGGFMHEKVASAAETCKGGRCEITRLWGEFLEEFGAIARGLSWCEAHDSGEDDPILVTIQRMPLLLRRLDAIAGHVRPYEQVVERAVRKALEERGGAHGTD